MSFRLSPGVRLRTRPEFQAAQREGRRVAGRWVTVLGRPSALPADRLGIIASRKLGGAVLRNRVKRRLREAFRLTEPDVVRAHGHHPLDLVVIPRREAARAPFEALRADLAMQITRLDRSRSR